MYENETGLPISRLFSTWSEQRCVLKSETDHTIFQPKIILGLPRACEMKPRLQNMAQKGFHYFLLPVLQYVTLLLTPYTLFSSHLKLLTLEKHVPLVSCKMLFSLPGVAFFFSLLIPGTPLCIQKDPEQASLFNEFHHN